MGLNEIVKSKPYKKLMAVLYGWGASLVILGALFKIMHYPGAGIMLLIGMGVEALIFFMSSFEPLHVEYNWALVYPELSMGEDAKDVKDDNKNKATGLTVTQELDNMLAEAKIGPELIDSLAKGMRNLSENANKLSGFSDAAVATDSYVTNLTRASESVRSLVSVYDKTADSLIRDTNISEAYTSNVQKAATAVGQLATIYEQTINSIKYDSGSYNTQLQQLSKNLSAINAAYEIQLQSAQSHVDLTNSVQANIQKFSGKLGESVENTLIYKEQIDSLTKNLMMLNTLYETQVQKAQSHADITNTLQSNIQKFSGNLNETVENTLKYKEQVDSLTKNVSMLNTVYGNMLSAMNVNR